MKFWVIIDQPRVQFTILQPISTSVGSISSFQNICVVLTLLYWLVKEVLECNDYYGLLISSLGNEPYPSKNKIAALVGRL